MTMSVQLLILGALLHDIGKFGQRAAAGYSSGHKDELLPKYKDRHSHWHALYTDYFIEHVLPLPADLEGHRSELATIAAAHHQPDSRHLSQMCVSQGDRLAAGLDRMPAETETADRQAFKKARLSSIFDEIELNRHAFQEPGQWFLPLKRLRLNRETLFPVLAPEGAASEYAELYAQFLKALEAIPEDISFTHYLPWLISILEEYTWCIPSSSYKSLPDISLFDHNLLTAGVAQALYAYHLEDQGHVDQGNDQAKFLLFGGDLSGIQNFIFHIQEGRAKGAGKLFRARSFYLQALTRSVILTVLKRLDLSVVAQVVDAGGKFTLLLPNTAACTRLAADLQEELDDFFMDRFKGSLSLTMATLPITPEHLKQEVFADVLEDFNACLNRNKTAKLRGWLETNGAVIHTGYQAIAEHGPCSICDQHPADTYLEPEQETACCAQCRDLINNIGRKLPQAAYIDYTAQQGLELFGGFKLRLHTHASSLQPETSELIQNTGAGENLEYSRFLFAGHIPTITPDDLKHKPFLDACEAEFHEDVSRLNPEDLAERPKTFNLIAQKALWQESDSVSGRPLLCILKADVDNLGLIFHLGLSGKISLSRYASLSRMMNIFFAGYLVEMIKTGDRFKDTYIVFAGGDDLFLLGPWHQTIDLALEVRKDFHRYCGNNPDLTLSCALEIAKPHLPLRRAADQAEVQLELVKKREKNGLLIKDGVSCFGQVLSWDELESQVAEARWLERQGTDAESHVSKIFLYRLLRYARQAESWQQALAEGGDLIPANGLYLSHALYDISRNIVRKEQGDIVNQEEVKHLTNLIDAAGGSQAFAKYSVALQYALCNLRT